ncbi:hypothetical protein THASP1DRAFT_15907 [Thamnocephalis sphaerospora]|uniref:DUF7707 domain-containing protein n=1 Tax=Thamnocephalis sphaerospora TaxID=78915 RepID=A0A4P9XSC4_9FUNG|nr:hypothetical protein THASP1DRAFT_15907 [Thamnocephalis sphaerospora]|eukprot:RKP08250.1 hypothetical protein THASP1DRAFT_15907 [Thamnocephalis sphaerospora]
MKVHAATASLAVCAVLAMLGSGAESLDPSKVSSADKQQWCLMQRTSCRNLCADNNKRTVDNTCDARTLGFTCTCSNGFVPDLNKYTQTIPFFQCQYDLTDCTGRCSGNEQCIANCRSQFVCGATDIEQKNETDTTTTSSTSTPTATKLPTATLDDGATGLHAAQAVGGALFVSGVAVLAAMAGI